MKKIAQLLLSVVFMFFSYAYAATTNWTDSSSVKRVNNIGSRILAANRLPNIKFSVIDSEEVNAFTDGSQIFVYTGLLKYVADDEELAGVIAHEVGHILNNHVAKQSVVNAIAQTTLAYSNLSNEAMTAAAIANNLSLLKLSRSEEYEADLTSVDLITKAGYNPCAMVSVIYKISGNYIDFIQSHPSGDKRTMYLYDYISYTYPSKAKTGYNSESYKQFMNYAKPIVTARNASPSKLKSFNKKQEKLKKKRIEKAKKYSEYTQSGWQSYYRFLQAVSSGQ